eukprot:3866172-Karenia_brevis.AAC.1
MGLKGNEGNRKANKHARTCCGKVLVDNPQTSKQLMRRHKGGDVCTSNSMAVSEAKAMTMSPGVWRSGLDTMACTMVKAAGRNSLSTMAARRSEL